MAQIIPFRGIRYNPDKITDMSNVVTPPYDRIYATVQDLCYDRDPHNIVRIIKGKQPSGMNGGDVYTRAAKYLAAWLQEGVLVRDETPAIYVYHQEYTFAGERLVRKGFVALGRLEPDKVHAHEKTLKGPKEDRLRLMRATEANFGQIFMLYSDSLRKAEEALAVAIEGVSPKIEAVDADGNIHRVWPITDPAVIQTVQASLAAKDLYIADGHHRYETAVNFMAECEEKGWREAAPESFGYRMMTLFNIAEPGMSVRPIHRLVHGIEQYDAAEFLAKAGEDFAVERYSSLQKMTAAVSAGAALHTFGCYTGGIYATLRLRDEATMDNRVSGDLSSDYKRLDVSILHAAILERLLGVDAQALAEQRNVTYTIDSEHGATMVDEGREQIFFLMNATTADEVIRVADHGEKMPQKSTDFYPKLLTGLVLSKMEIEKSAVQ